jgi:hypothetical protein
VDGLGGSNDAAATFYIPYLGNIVSGARVNLSATVSEPVGKKKEAVVAACEAVMVIN